MAMDLRETLHATRREWKAGKDKLPHIKFASNL
jgi:hypothetical protein